MTINPHLRWGAALGATVLAGALVAPASQAATTPDLTQAVTAKVTSKAKVAAGVR